MAFHLSKTKSNAASLRRARTACRIRNKKSSGPVGDWTQARTVGNPASGTSPGPYSMALCCHVPPTFRAARQRLPHLVRERRGPCGSRFRLSLQKPLPVPVREKLTLLQARQGRPDLWLRNVMPVCANRCDYLRAGHALFPLHRLINVMGRGADSG